jgi:hypothetical protein
MLGAVAGTRGCANIAIRGKPDSVRPFALTTRDTTTVPGGQACQIDASMEMHESVRRRLLCRDLPPIFLRLSTVAESHWRKWPGPWEIVRTKIGGFPLQTPSALRFGTNCMSPMMPLFMTSTRRTGSSAFAVT